MDKHRTSIGQALQESGRKGLENSEQVFKPSESLRLRSFDIGKGHFDIENKWIPMGSLRLNTLHSLALHTMNMFD
jgi:hypothetical protein